MTVYARGEDGELVWEVGSGRKKKSYAGPTPKQEEPEMIPLRLKDRVMGFILRKAWSVFLANSVKGFIFRFDIDKKGYSLVVSLLGEGEPKVFYFSENPQNCYKVYPK